MKKYNLFHDCQGKKDCLNITVKFGYSAPIMSKNYKSIEKLNMKILRSTIEPC